MPDRSSRRAWRTSEKRLWSADEGGLRSRTGRVSFPPPLQLGLRERLRIPPLPARRSRFFGRARGLERPRRWRAAPSGLALAELLRGCTLTTELDLSGGVPRARSLHRRSS